MSITKHSCPGKLFSECPWKTPLYKKGNKFNARNYRPVTEIYNHSIYSKKNKSLLKIYIVVLSVSSLSRFISNSIYVVKCYQKFPSYMKLAWFYVLCIVFTDRVSREGLWASEVWITKSTDGPSDALILLEIPWHFDRGKDYHTSKLN